jgi:NAD(P)-dependent dehydrogenase (short-subunit alcohol dehydrogenase family)
LDVIINNAGRGITRNPSELTDEDIDDMMAINVKSAIYGMQASVTHAPCAPSSMSPLLSLLLCHASEMC